MIDTYLDGLREALQIAERAARPLGAYGGASDSDWNRGYTRARDDVVVALSKAINERRTRTQGHAETLKFKGHSSRQELATEMGGSGA